MGDAGGPPESLSVKRPWPGSWTNLSLVVADKHSVSRLIASSFHGEGWLDMEMLRGVSTGCSPVTWTSCSLVTPSAVGGGNAEFGTDFVAFNSSCRLLPTSMHGMSQLNSDLWDAMELEGCCSITQAGLISGVRACKERGYNYLFSVVFSWELHKARVSARSWDTPMLAPSEQRPWGSMWTMFADPRASGQHYFAVLWAQPPAVKGKWLLTF